MSIAIKMDSVSKRYRARHNNSDAQAVTCLSLSIPAEQVVGLLGHTGAGKTTVLKLMGGLLEPTAGCVRVNGYDVVREHDAARRQVYVALNESAGLHTCTIPAQPIILLDEPALGPEPRAVGDWLKELAHRHAKTVVLATRDLVAARELCDRVAILSRGRLVAEREAYFLADRFLARPFYHIRVKGHLGSSWAVWFDGLALTTEENGDMVLSGPIVDQAALHGVLAKVRNLGLPLLSVTCCDINLGEMFPRSPDWLQTQEESER